MTEAKGKELTKAQSKELAALYEDTGIEERAGEATEGATQDDYAMPFLSLLQSGSPQCKTAQAFKSGIISSFKYSIESFNRSFSFFRRCSKI